MAANAPDEPQGGQHLVFGKKHLHDFVVGGGQSLGGRERGPVSAETGTDRHTVPNAAVARVTFSMSRDSWWAGG